MTKYLFKEIKEMHKQYPTVPFPIAQIAEDNHIALKAVLLGMNAGKVFKKNGVYHIHINLLDITTTQRFTVAHELGHYFKHRHLIDEYDEIIDQERN